MMEREETISVALIEDYLHSRPRLVRWTEWLAGRRYRLARFGDRRTPLVVVAYSFRDSSTSREVALAAERDWPGVPNRCREAYDEILFKAPEILVLQLRRKNLCGCLGHRHVVVRDAPFAEPHEAFGGAGIGEIDIAWRRVETWQALPLTDTAFDTKFLEGTRREEFRAHQFRLKTLSIILHEINHLVAPQEPEDTVRERSLSFYREALAGYMEETMASLSLTIDRSFSRLE
jgi:hypothetical protein